ncbi:hypothetical protein CAC42_2937 [Sphaceloma murrayae]|uniref:U3 small nucleolar RNA-associated protein 18 n=1 Tax=Sphaceloma murrayae TaxID=2082308 RepID=A0A2K1R068_9PEZI|nr:hypothetical protein CAC42_2937 [Sphaceloma murrayae]
MSQLKHRSTIERQAKVYRKKEKRGSQRAPQIGNPSECEDEDEAGQQLLGELHGSTNCDAGAAVSFTKHSTTTCQSHLVAETSTIVNEYNSMAMDEGKMADDAGEVDSSGPPKTGTSPQKKWGRSRRPKKITTESRDIARDPPFMQDEHDHDPALEDEYFKTRFHQLQSDLPHDPRRAEDRKARREKRIQQKEARQARDRELAEAIKREELQKIDQKYDTQSAGVDDLLAVTQQLDSTASRIKKNQKKNEKKKIKKAARQGLTLEEWKAKNSIAMPSKSKARQVDDRFEDDMAQDMLRAAKKRTMTVDSDDSEMEIDEGERELARMVFGDQQSFLGNLKSFGHQEKSLVAVGNDADDVDAEDDDMAGMEDQDLFFTDTTGTTLPPSARINGGVSDDDSDVSVNGFAHQKAAWHDSDDDRIRVSLASVPRLRKLRTTADEDIVSGREYIKRLRKQYVLLNPTPGWASSALEPPTKKRRLSGSDSDSDSDSDTDLPSSTPLSALLRSTTSLTTPQSQKRKLPPTTLNIQRLPDLIPSHPAPVTTLHHHPTLPLLLSSNPSGTLYLHHLVPSPPSEKANPLLTSLHLKSTALSTVAFHPTAPKIYLSARRRYFHVWDLASGQMEKVTRALGTSGGGREKSAERLRVSPDGTWIAVLGSGRRGGGEVHFLDSATMQWKVTMRVEGRGGVADGVWWGDGRGMSVLGKGGEVTEFDVVREEVVGRWGDEGATGATVLALGGKTAAGGPGRDRWVAVGGEAGIVNLYDKRAWTKPGDETNIPDRPSPSRVLDHLTTPISCLAFSPDGQLLAIASRWKKDALRLVHLPSCTVYRNWPTKATPLGRITSLAFGEMEGGGGGVGGGGGGGGAKGDGGAMGLFVGNESGKIRVWEIRP